MSSLADISVDFVANLAQFRADLNQMASSVQSTGAAVKSSCNEMSESFNKMKESFNQLREVWVVEKLAEGFKEVVDATSKTQAAMAQVNAAIASTGGAAGVSAKQVDELSDSLRKMTGIDNAALDSMQSILLSFSKVGKEVFPEASRACVDLAARMGGDLNGAAKLLGRALSDPEKGMTALKRAGVVLSDSQKDMIKQFEATGDSLSAQKLIIDAVEHSCGGAAAAARDNLGGAFKALKSSVEECFATIGNSTAIQDFRKYVEMANIAMEEFTEAIKTGALANDPMVKSLEQFGQIAGQVFGVALSAAKLFVNMIIEGFKDMGDVMNQFFMGFNNIAKALHIDGPIKQMFQNVTAAAQTTFGALNGVLTDSAKSGIHDYVGDFFQPMKDEYKKLEDEATKRMDSIHALATQKRSPMGGDDQTGEQAKAAEKLAKERDKEFDTLNKIMKAEQDHVSKLQDELNGTKGLTDEANMYLKIMSQTNVPLEMRLTLLNKAQALEADAAKIKAQIDDGKEVKSLQDILAKEKERTDELTNRLNKTKEQTELEKAESEIAKVTKGDLSAHKDLQEQILKQVKDRIAAEKQENEDKGLDALDKILQKDTEAAKEAQLKLQGQKDLIPLIQQEEQIKEQISKFGLDENDPAVASKLQAIRDQEQATLDLNNQLTLQKTNYDSIMSDTSSFKEKMDALTQGLHMGVIASDDYTKGMQKLGDEIHKANEEDAKQFVGTLEKGFDQAIQGGKKLSDIFKQLGKDLIELAAKQLLFKPLENWLGSGMQGGLGGLIGGIAAPIKNLIPKFAAGGFASGLSVVGEQGPELFLPPAGGGMVFPNQIFEMFMNMMGMGGGGNTGGMLTGGGGMGMLTAGGGGASRLPGYQLAGGGGVKGLSGGGGLSAGALSAGGNSAELQGLLDGSIKNKWGNSIYGPGSLIGSRGGFTSPSTMPLNMFGLGGGGGGGGYGPGGGGIAPTSSQQLQIEQDQALVKYQQAQIAYEQDPSDHNATYESMAQNQYTFWEGQTPGTVSQMQWDTQGEFQNMQKVGLQNYGNIPLSVMQYLSGKQANLNYGLTYSMAGSGGGGAGGGDDGSGFFGGGLNPGGIDSTLFGPGGGDGGSGGDGGGDGGIVYGGNPWEPSSGGGDGGIDLGGLLSGILGGGDVASSGGDGVTNYDWNNPNVSASYPYAELDSQAALAYNHPVQGQDDFSSNYAKDWQSTNGNGHSDWIDSNGINQDNQFVDDGTGKLTDMSDFLKMVHDSAFNPGMENATLQDVIQKFTGSSDQPYQWSAANSFGGMGANNPYVNYGLDPSQPFGGAGKGGGGNWLGYAAGGRPNPYDPAWVGEMGKELFVPDRPGTIVPNDKLYAGGDPNGVPNVNIHNYTPHHIDPSVSFSQGADGRTNMEVVIQDMVARSMYRGRAHNAVKNVFGAKTRGVQRS